jgi:hypothetical protein
MANPENGKLTKIYKIITPESPRTSVTDSQDLAGNYGLYGNYSFMNKLMQGSSMRLQRYREYDMMDEDTDVSRALDIIAEEIVGNNPKSDLPLILKITAGEEQQVNSRTVVTLKAALNTWCNIHRWNRRLYTTVRNTIKYGDTFFFRNEKPNLPNKYVNPKHVIGAVVTKTDVNDVKGWQIQTDYDKASQNINFAITGNSSQTYNVENYTPEEVIRFGLHDDMSDEAPFSQSILKAAYKIFKQKQMLEDSLLIYRIQRAPEKRVFKLEIGNTPPHLKSQILENAKNEIKQRKIPTPYGGGNQVESIYSPMSMNEDFFFTMKNGVGSTVETLPGGQNLGQLDDLNYFYSKMWRALRIPQSYMDNGVEGGTPFNDGKVGIAYQQEIKFTLYIESLQVHFEDILDREFKKFLRDQKINIDPTIFKVVLPEPSNFKKSRDNEIDQTLVALATSAGAIDWLSKRYIAIHYLQMTKADLLINERQKAEELGLDPNDTIKNMAKIYSPENADSGGYDGGMTGGSGGSSDLSGMPADDIGGDDDGADTGEAGTGEENAKGSANNGAETGGNASKGQNPPKNGKT